MDSIQLKNRTKIFALQVIQFVQTCSKTDTNNILTRQVLRSATSIGANYRAACRARSKKDFISKIKIVEEEADETIYWLELLREQSNIDLSTIQQLHREANELTAIFTTMGKTARSNLKPK